MAAPAPWPGPETDSPRRGAGCPSRARPLLTHTEAADGLVTGIVLGTTKVTRC